MSRRLALRAALTQLIASRQARAASLYLGGNIAAAFIPFLLLPVLTRALPPLAYGQYSMFQIISSNAVAIVTWMLPGILIREYHLRDATAYARLFTLCVAGSLLLAGGWMALAWASSGVMVPLLQLSLPWMEAGIFCALAQGILIMVQNLLSMQKRPARYLGWRLGFALAMGLVWYWGARRGYGHWQLIGALQTLVSGVCLLLLLVYLWRAGQLRRLRWDAAAHADLSLMVRYSTPLVVNALTASVVLQSADRLLVSHYLGLPAAGIYHVAQQVGLAMFVIVQSLNLVWNPWFHERMKEDGPAVRRQVVRAMYGGFAALAGLGALATLAIWWLFPYLIGAQFLAARAVFPWLMAAGVLNGMYVFVASPLFYFGQTRQLMWCNLGTAGVLILLGVVLVPAYGLLGAAITTLLATVFMCSSVWLTVARTHSFPWRLQTSRVAGGPVHNRDKGIES